MSLKTLARHPAEKGSCLCTKLSSPLGVCPVSSVSWENPVSFSFPKVFCFVGGYTRWCLGLLLVLSGPWVSCAQAFGPSLALVMT